MSWPKVAPRFFLPIYEVLHKIAGVAERLQAERRSGGSAWTCARRLRQRADAQVHAGLKPRGVIRVHASSSPASTMSACSNARCAESTAITSTPMRSLIVRESFAVRRLRRAVNAHPFQLKHGCGAFERGFGLRAAASTPTVSDSGRASSLTPSAVCRPRAFSGYANPGACRALRRFRATAARSCS